MIKKTKRVLIIGAGIAGRDVFRAITANPSLAIEVVGFIDDNLEKKHMTKLPILGTKDNLKNIVSDKKVDEIIIAIPSAEGKQIAEFVKLCSDAKVGFKIVPRVTEIIEGKVNINTIREVQIEDLLGRPVIKSDVEELKDFFRARVVLVTGAAGSIGSELSRQIAAYKPKGMILLDIWENGIFDLQNELKRLFPDTTINYVIANIQERKKMKKIIQTFSPHYVFHAAAYKHVPLMEDNPEEAIKNNVFGTLNLAEESVKNNVERFVLVSTDKAAEPLSIMGTTKLIAEGIVQYLNGHTKFMSVRFGNVLDSHGSVLQIFKKQIKDGGPITITDPKMTRYFMTIPESVQLILKAASLGKGGELFVLDMGNPIKITELAENFIRLHGLVPNKDIKVIYTGKRKGEKINERLFTKKEKMTATKKEKIYTTKSLGIDIKNIPSILRNLRQLVDEEKLVDIKSNLKHILRNFLS